MGLSVDIPRPCSGAEHSSLGQARASGALVNLEAKREGCGVVKNRVTPKWVTLVNGVMEEKPVVHILVV